MEATGLGSEVGSIVGVEIGSVGVGTTSGVAGEISETATGFLALGVVFRVVLVVFAGFGGSLSLGGRSWFGGGFTG